MSDSSIDMGIDLWRVAVQLRRDTEEIARLEARVAELEAGHCKDCCCARLWAVLGISGYTGKSLVEHVDELKQREAAAKVEGQTLALTTAVEQLLLPIPRRVVIDRLRAEIAALERGKE